VINIFASTLWRERERERERERVREKRQCPNIDLSLCRFHGTID